MLITRASKAMRFDLSLLHIDPDAVLLIRPCTCRTHHQVCVLAPDGESGKPIAFMPNDAYQQLLEYQAITL